MFRESRVRILFAEWLFTNKTNYGNANNNDENNTRNKTIYAIKVELYQLNKLIQRDHVEWLHREH